MLSFCAGGADYSCFTAAQSGCTILMVSLTGVSGAEVLSVSGGWVIINESGDDVTVSETICISIIAPLVVSVETESTIVVSLETVTVIALVVSEISDFSNPAPLKSLFASTNC